MRWLLTEHTYPGECPRPAPVIDMSEKDNLLLLSTPWGQQSACQTANAVIKDFVTAAESDPESTSPFQQLPSLSPRANHLRIGMLLANQSIYQKLNRNRYDSGCESLVLSLRGRELTWAQVGQPSLILIREQKLIILNATPDLSLDFEMSAPLPGRLIGIENQVEVETNSVLIKPHDQILFVSCSKLPESFFGGPVSTQTPEGVIKELVDLAVAENSALPFWLGLLTLTP